MLLSALAALLIAAAMSPAAAAAPGEEPRHAVSGQVRTLGGTGVPALIYVYQSTLEAVTEAATNEYGEFSVELPDGDYILDVRATTGSYALSLRHEVAVDGAAVSLPAIELSAGTVISGVARFDGVPASSVRVQLQTVGASPKLVDYATTDANGRYRIVLPNAAAAYHLLVPNPDPNGRPAWETVNVGYHGGAGGGGTGGTGGAGGTDDAGTAVLNRPALTIELKDGQASASLGGMAWTSYIEQLQGDLSVQAPADAMSFALSVSPEVLAALFEKSESSAFAVTLGDVVYRLPAVLFAPDRLRQLKEKVQDGVEGQWTLEIVVQKATAAELALLRESAEQLGAELIAAPSPAAFSIRAVYGENRYEWEDFGSALVSRTFQLSSGQSTAGYAGVVATEGGGLRPVPTLVREASDGSAFVELRRNGNSLYALLRMEAAFEDVTESHWAHDSIGRLAARLIVQGDGDGRFRPNVTVTRAEFAAMLVRSLGLTPKRSEGLFKDVTEAYWAAGEVQAAYDAGIVRGLADGRFEPEAMVSREDAAVMLARASVFAGKQDELLAEAIATAVGRYKDASAIAEYAREGVAYGIVNGVITGKPGALIDPDGNATRAEAATFILRMLRSVELGQ